ncbi:MAG: 2-keto-4-pentenoate hydratase [Alphaproteobacteria bacterium]|nr:2-keto-4-pentenoate hydratase [Alphaproteobacteria bacterium]MDE2042440.1 2-keto-4-pentenoate hydratase [Alphaproteobacteria bacterium]MDE2339802.1 2-keto-4-pentenoate hydratase [Alphaproteobacteria bacterium]
MTTGEIEAIAQALVSARTHATGLPEFPGAMPAALDVAYAVQARMMALLDQPVAGWKIGRINGDAADRFGADRLAGPIFAGQIVDAAAGRVPEVAGYGAGFIAAEAELMVRLRADVAPDPQPLSLEEVAGMIDAVHAGIELASSPFTGINDNGPCVTAADLGNSKTLVIGDAIAEPALDTLLDWPVTLAVDGEVVGNGTARGLPDGPLGAVRFLLAHLGARGIMLNAETWISTGAITGVHVVQPGQSVRARFGETLCVKCSISALEADA